MKTLQTLLEMAKRSTPHGFYELAKKKYGAEKVKALKWPEIAALAKENDVLIPPYLRSQKVGRGLFNLVPQDHADAKPAPKEEPKKLSSDAVKTTTARMASDATKSAAQPADKATLKDVKAALANGMDALHQSSKSTRWAEYRSSPQDMDDDTWSVEVRDWGNWVVPEDAQDDEDYDWKVLDASSAKELQRIETVIANKWKARGVEIWFSQQEKNWITVSARAL